MTSSRQTVRTLLVLALIAPALPGNTQSAGDAGSLPVTRCDPRTNSCASGTTRDVMPALGSAGRATVLSPSLRTTEIGVDGNGEQVPVPGCSPLRPGVLLCNSIHEFQHCRTLMISSMVGACRVEIAFARDDVVARPAEPGSYRLAVESTARVRINRDSRGFGEARGRARVTLDLDLPAEASAPGWCVERERYLYYATGTEGGNYEIDNADDCADPIDFSFGANDDDLMRAWDLCETFAAWDEELTDSIEILAAGIFQVRSAAPDFSTRYPGGSVRIARYLRVEAPLTIDCRG